MSQASSSRKSSGSLSLNLRIDEACDRFELAWQAGQRPSIEDYLGDTPEPERSALLREFAEARGRRRRVQQGDPQPEPGPRGRIASGLPWPKAASALTIERECEGD
jgi:hypothetical protein